MPLHIIADTRERNLELIGRLEERGIEVRVDTLPVGDYAVSDRVCIERKTIGDFESSIITGRLFEQAKRLTEAYEHPIIILEGEREEFRMKRNAISGAIASLCIDYRIFMLSTFSPEETADTIAYIAKHESEKMIREPSIKGGARAFTQSQFMERVVGNMPGIGSQTARNLLLHFGSIRNVASAQEKELVEVKNVGKKRAKAIYELMGTEYSKEISKERQNDWIPNEEGDEDATDQS